MTEDKEISTITNLKTLRNKKRETHDFNKRGSTTQFSTWMWMWTLVWELCETACGSWIKRLMIRLKRLMRADVEKKKEVEEVRKKIENRHKREDTRRFYKNTNESTTSNSKGLGENASGKVHEVDTKKPDRTEDRKKMRQRVEDDLIKKRKERVNRSVKNTEERSDLVHTNRSESGDLNHHNSVLSTVSENTKRGTDNCTNEPPHTAQSSAKVNNFKSDQKCAIKLSEAKENYNKKCQEVVLAKQTKEELSQLKLELSQKQHSGHDFPTEPLAKAIVELDTASYNLKKKESELLTATMKEKFLKISFAHRSCK
jgi:hypothetical protein